MIARFKNWYYGEDGMNPIYRTWKFHKFFMALLVGSFLFSFFVLELDGLPIKLLGTCAFFAFFLCMGILPPLEARVRDKRARYEQLANRSLSELRAALAEA